MLVPVATILFLIASSSTAAQSKGPNPLKGEICGLNAPEEYSACCNVDIKKYNFPSTSFNVLGLKLTIPFTGRYDRFVTKLNTFMNGRAESIKCIEGGIDLIDANGQCKCVEPEVAKATIQGATEFVSSPYHESGLEMCNLYFDAASRVSIPKSPNPESDEAKARKEQTAANQREQIRQELASCIGCAEGGGYYSGLGCISFTSQSIFLFIFRLAISFAGFYAFLCILYSSYTIQTARGNADNITKARERLTSCIVGLILIIFSVFILVFIGIDVLGLPGINL